MVGKTKSAAKGPSEKAESTETAVKKRGRSPGRKSPARTKSPARQKSPGATKSPRKSKSPARNRSPARSKKASSPARKSPSRQPASKSQEEKNVVRPKKQVIIDSEDDSDFQELVKEVKEKPKATVRGRTRRIDIEIDPVRIFDSIKQSTTDDDRNSVSESVKRVTRSQNREVERVVHLKHFESVSKKLGEFSDEDEVVEAKKKVDFSEVAKKSTEYGGIIGTSALILLMPALVVSLNVLCDASQCSFRKVPSLDKYRSLSTWFDAKAALIYAAYLTVLALLTALPFGGRRVSGFPNKHGKLEYNMNGFFALIAVMSVAIGLQLKNVPAFSYIVNHVFHFLIAAIVGGLLLTLYAYVRSFYVPVSALNVQGVGRKHLYSFFVGREVNPRVLGLVDLKVYVTRLSVIGTLLINTAYLCKSLGSFNKVQKQEGLVAGLKSLNYDPTVLAYYAISTFYLLDYFFTESTWISTNKFHYDGFGYISGVGSSLYPFLFALVIRYIVDHHVQYNHWTLALILLVFLAGYVLYRAANNQKYSFKKNPYSPSVSNYDTIPTTQGNKLLASGLWGFVRHPNYLGDILINLSLGSFVYSAPAVLGVLSIVLVLIHRSVRDNARCKQKYGAAWDRYCGKVKYVLVPKIY